MTDRPLDLVIKNVRVVSVDGMKAAGLSLDVVAYPAGFSQRVRALSLPGRLLSVIAPLLTSMRHLNRQLAYWDATIEHLAVQGPRVPRLRSVPSVGPVAAAAFIAAIDDAQRFHHAQYLGRETMTIRQDRRWPRR
jgi:transposase